MPKINLSLPQALDTWNLVQGAYAPLEGFLGQEDFFSVIKRMRLGSGEVWAIPIVLDVKKTICDKVAGTGSLALLWKNQILAKLVKPKIYALNRQAFAHAVCQTGDPRHPGVKRIMSLNPYCLSGRLIKNPALRSPEFARNFLSPKQAKQIFARRSWKTIAAFQTRNIPHRGHEFVQRHALTKVDGIFIQPAIGPKKSSDFPDAIIVRAYQVYLKKIFPAHKAVLGTLPYAMYYAGPREAVHHAIIRRNFGATHFIVGRDHAGVGNYYPPKQAGKLLAKLAKKISIQPMIYPEVVYNTKTKKLCFGSNATSPKTLSASLIRDLLKKRQPIPNFLARQQIIKVCAKDYSQAKTA